MRFSHIVKSSLFLPLFFLCSSECGAVSPADSLTANVEILPFFVNNEFEGRALRGYTLPGTRLKPMLRYSSSDKLCVEAGASAIIYDGAYKYPSVAYHGLPEWKGEQYQKGAHIVPWMRVEGRIDSLTVALGSSDRDHQLPTPLFNSEMQLTADPEMGARVRYRRGIYNCDVWLDWQSFIYNYDGHQEVFTAGAAQEFLLYEKRADAGLQHSFRLSVPVVLLAQHRGGETDANEGEGAQTAWNASAGLKGVWTYDRKCFSNIEVEALALGCKQQGKKRLWPFRSGVAAWLGAKAQVIPSVFCETGVFLSEKYVSLYGAPFFSTMSITYEGGKFSRMDMLYLSGSYKYGLTKNCSLTAFCNAYFASRGSMDIPRENPPLPEGEWTEKARFCTSFSIGVKFNVNLDFLLFKTSKSKNLITP